MSPGELWAECVFSEWDWDLFWGKIPLVMRDFGMLLWFEWVLQVLLLETSSALQWYWKVRPFRDQVRRSEPSWMDQWCHGRGEVAFAGGCSKWKDAQPDLCTYFSFSCFPSHTLSLSAFYYRWCNKKTLARCLSLGILISHQTLRDKSALYKFLSHESFVIVAQVTLRQTHDLLAM